MSKALEDWWASPLGVQVREEEKHVVAESLDDVFGFQFLQVGGWGPAGDFFTAARTQRQVVISTTVSPPNLNSQTDFADTPVAQVYCRPSELGVASDSVDAVLLPHTLEFEADPYVVLREVERILTGEGKLLILSFNPISLWGLRHRFSRHGMPPGLERLLSERRLRDWLALLSFQVTGIRRYLFQLPWPMPASAYLLKAHKRLYAPTPKRAWRREVRARVGGLEPTTRNFRNHE